MKCPKCDYLGFETGNRCKNCGYDFSLLATRAAPPHALKVDVRELPLFAPPGADDDDEPLIRVPAAPRAPLSVRKTPDTPRLRAAALPPPRAGDEPILQFTDETVPFVDLPLRDEEPAARVAVDVGRTPAAPAQRTPTSASRRLGAAGVDHLILFAIDAAVVYFTLRISALPLTDWQLLPPIPLLAFLGLLKFAYFCAFTAVGGQTIGKMALGIRVVTDDNAAVDGSRAIQRTIAGVAAFALGLGFIPALVGAERRAFHDRVARTRVVALRSA
ncbi:MAG TPA: RDD family protein [Vicinamibacterales bacterium]